MQRLPQKQGAQRLQPPAARSALAREATVANRGRRHNYLVPSSSSSSSRPQKVCTCSNRPGSVPCTRHGYAVPTGEKLRRQHVSKEVLKRALTPPVRRLSLRWWNFRPTPSRLSNMSMS